MPGGIPPPPVPPKALLAAAGLASVAVGALLNLWGRRTGRAILALLAAGLAAASAPWIAQHIPFKNVWVLAPAAAVTAALATVVLARGVWAVGLGTCAGVLVLMVLTGSGAATMPDEPAWPDQKAERFSDWAGTLGEYLLGWAKGLWAHHRELLAAAVGLPVAVCLGLEMIFARSVVIFASGALGAVGVIGGGGLLVWSCRPEWARAWADHADLLAGIAGGLALVGMACQLRAELHARHGDQAKPGEPDIAASEDA